MGNMILSIKMHNKILKYFKLLGGLMISEKIRSAIHQKERLFIVYQGGSQSGTVREIAPLQYDDNTGHLRARCYNTNAVKIFIDNLIKVIDADDVSNYQITQHRDKAICFSNLEDVYEYYVDTFESMGWGVQYSARPESLGLHHYFKNGKIKKNPIISIRFSYLIDEEMECLDSSLDILDEDIQSSKRPWSLRAQGYKPRNFRSLGAAIVSLAQYANKIEPNSSTVKGNRTLDLYELTEIKLIKSIINKRITLQKTSFERLQSPLIVPKVSYFPEKQQGCLNNQYWKYRVGYAFRDALDLKYQQRVEKKNKVYVWTQGPLIAFKEGDYLQPANDGPTLQVKFATPMGWDIEKNAMYEGSVTYINCDDRSQHLCTQLQFLAKLIYGNNYSGL